MKQYKLKEKDGRIYMLHLGNGLFGSQWECFGAFDSGNMHQCRQIIELLNECETLTNRDNEH